MQTNDTTQTLDAILKNTGMGMGTLEQLLPMAGPEPFRHELLRQQDIYRQLDQEARQYAELYGMAAQGQPPLTQASTRLGIAMKTFTDRSTRNLAGMLAQGSSQGVMDCIKCQKDYPLAENSAKRLLQRLRDFEEDNRARLEAFL